MISLDIEVRPVTYFADLHISKINTCLTSLKQFTLTNITKRVATITFEFFTLGVSVRLSDRSLHREEQKRIVKNCPQWGLKPEPPDLQANALPTKLSQHSAVSLEF